MSEVAATAITFGDRSAPFMLSVDGSWVDPADTADNVAWMREVIGDAAERACGSGQKHRYPAVGRREAADGAFWLAALGANVFFTYARRRLGGRRRWS